MGKGRKWIGRLGQAGSGMLRRAWEGTGLAGKDRRARRDWPVRLGPAGIAWERSGVQRTGLAGSGRIAKVC